MTPKEIAEKKVADATAVAEKVKADAAKKAADDLAASQDPLKAEAERIQKEKAGRSELEKAIFTRDQVDKRIKELRGESDDLDHESDDLEDDAPVTVGMLKKRDQERATKSALDLAAEQVTDETERSLVIHHLENSVKPSGNAASDLAKARAIVNEVKNRQIAEEAKRRQSGRSSGKGSGAPGISEEMFEPTAEEASFMKPPFNLSKEKILAARKKEANSAR